MFKDKSAVYKYGPSKESAMFMVSAAESALFINFDKQFTFVYKVSE